MKSKLGRILRLLYAFIFLLALFTLIRLLVLYYYHLCQTNGNYTIAMMLLDKVDKFNLFSYIQGWLHCGVVGVMLKILLDK